MFCPRCGQPTDDRAQFCQQCGSNLRPAVQALSGGTAVAFAPAPVKQYGGFWIRFLAILIDGLLIGVLTLPVSLILGASIALAGSAVRMPDMGVVMVRIIVGFTFGMLVGWLYAAGMESSSRQATIGKMALNLRVTDLAGQRISFGRATGRHFAKLISCMTLYIGYIMAGFTDRHQALHDLIAGTLVERS